jgi:O-acetylhomoserine/O-acetylserine sulfhydrylase-like pyridoxal-dependent enzyme
MGVDLQSCRLSTGIEADIIADLEQPLAQVG